MYLQKLTAIALLCLSLPAAAEKQVSSLFDDETNSPTALVSDLGWGDERYLKAQVERIDEIARQNLGRPVRGDDSDLALLQKIVYRGLIAADDRQNLQAMGVVLGNLMVRTEGLEWKVYEDELGRSRAVCADEEHCLFPVTMLSRRMQVGLMPDVEKIYRDAMALIKPYLPKNPYDL